MSENYSTGYKAVVTITATTGPNGETSGSSFTGGTYSKAKVAELPKSTAGIVTIQHMGGVEKVADGPTDYGRIVITIANDGSALAKDGYFNVTITPKTGALKDKTGTCTKVYCTEDDQGSAQKGQSIDRKLTFELLTSEIAWA